MDRVSSIRTLRTYPWWANSNGLVDIRTYSFLLLGVFFLPAAGKATFVFCGVNNCSVAIKFLQMRVVAIVVLFVFLPLAWPAARQVFFSPGSSIAWLLFSIQNRRASVFVFSSSMTACLPCGQSSCGSAGSVIARLLPICTIYYAIRILFVFVSSSCTDCRTTSKCSSSRDAFP